MAQLTGQQLAMLFFRGDGVKYELFAPVAALADDVDPYSGPRNAIAARVDEL
jgi:hypothetical protein